MLATMTWTGHLADEAVKQLKAIPPDRRKRILDDIRAMADTEGFPASLLVLVPNERTYR